MQPLLFGKFTNTLIGPGEPIVLPRESTHVDAEAELAVEIGRAGRRIAEVGALDHVRGYRCANDLSARNIQYTEAQWTRAKGFDTFCPLGSRARPGVGARRRQRPARRAAAERRGAAGRQHVAICSSGVPFLVAYISNTFTLEPGDLILTGTPPGVGWARDPKVALAPGDVVEVEVEGIGVVSNPVVAE